MQQDGKQISYNFEHFLSISIFCPATCGESARFRGLNFGLSDIFYRKHNSSIFNGMGFVIVVYIVDFYIICCKYLKMSLSGRGAASSSSSGGKAASSSSSGRGAASYSMGIDDAVLLMTSVVIENMINLGEGRHSTVISNDRFQDYAYGTRLHYEEIEHENTMAWLRSSDGARWATEHPKLASERARTPSKLRRLNRIPNKPPLGRLISIEAEDTREYFETKFDDVRGVVLVRRQTGPYSPVGPDNNWLPLNESGLFFRECLALLRSKLTGFSGGTDFARGLQQAVFELSNKIAMNMRNCDVAYIVDVENIFYIRYGGFEKRFKTILPALNTYFRRRYRGQLMWGPDGKTGEEDSASLGQRIMIVLPVYDNKQKPMCLALEAALNDVDINGNRLGDTLKYNINVISFNIDFFNRLARSSTPITRTRGAKSGGGAAGGGKRRKTGPRSLHKMFALLRF